MQRLKYREERTLTRGLLRMPKESIIDFKRRVRILRERYEQFNVDVSDLCQWLMGIRPVEGKGGDSAKPFWEFMLSPTTGLENEDSKFLDRLRLDVFNCAMDFESNRLNFECPLPQALLESIHHVSKLGKTESTRRLLIRLDRMKRDQRVILVKAACDWVSARYDRLIQTWNERRPEWESEKLIWELSHFSLSEEIRNSYTSIFKALEIKKKNPRLCLAEKLFEDKNNCDYAGERIPTKDGFAAHSPLCKKYWEFKRKYETDNPRYVGKFRREFAAFARLYIDISARTPKLSFEDKMREVKVQSKTNGKLEGWWFPEAFRQYLNTLNITVSTLRTYARLPHCLTFNNDCEFNVHTDACLRYKEYLKDQSPHFISLDRTYRQWRKKYLSGPKRPSFRYPSSSSLPAPKIFGIGYYEIDFEESVVKLRLDEMKQGEFLDFRFKPWPKQYDVSASKLDVTSVHLSFIGTRAKIGFRFSVMAKPSRFRITQEEIEKLYTPKEEDRSFPIEARDTILAGFSGEAENDMRILAVDLGTTGGASASLFQGRQFRLAETIKIYKVDSLYASAKEFDPNLRYDNYKKGLTKDHVGRHVNEFGTGAGKIAIWKGISKEFGAAGLGPNDLRGLAIHTRWMIRDWARLNASQIMRIAEKEQADLIVLESLRGYLAPGYEELKDEKKRMMAFFAYGLVRRKVTEKAIERGMRVVTVPYKCSSQVCCGCGKPRQDEKRWRDNKSDSKFICEFCKLDINSDENAARVIGKVFWGEVVLPERKEKAT